jgi:hypothetical protein
MDPEALFRLLLDEGWVEAADLERLLEDFEAGSLDLFDFLEASGVGAKQDILRMIATAHGWESVDFGNFQFSHDLNKSISEDLMRIYRCVPIHDSPDVLKVCFVDPLDDVAIDELRKLLGRRIEVVIADPHDIEERVRAIVDDASFDFSPAGTALEGASEGGDQTAQVDDSRRSYGRGIRMAALAMLAASAAAVTFMHMRQRHSSQAVKVVLEEFEAYKEDHRSSQLTWERQARDLKLELDRLGNLLKRGEAEATKFAQLEAGIQRLEGKLESLTEIKSLGNSADESTDVQNGSGE